MKRILGLDSFRAIGAIIVMMGHGAVPPITSGYDESSFWAWAFNGVYGGSFSGPAAVIMFFVISGICIHYPYAEGKKMDLEEFFIRRYIRILIPMIAAVLLARITGFVSWDNPRLIAGIPGWSLIAEMIYYAIYPLLLILTTNTRVKWKTLVYITFVIALVLAFTKPIDNINYPAWGYEKNWILGLPCWLMGVLLADNIGKTSLLNPSRINIWAWRLGAILLASITRNLAFQGIVGNHLTLNFFAIYVFFWLIREIAYFQNNPTSLFWEWAGKWSYSLFLIHPFAFYLLETLNLPDFGDMTNWLIKFNFALAITLLFYYMVEKPSHIVARKAGKVKLFSGRAFN